MVGSVVITGGGTGGHIFPGLAVAEELFKRNIKVVWVGSKRGMEADLLTNTNISIHLLGLEGLRGRGWRGLIVAPILAVKALIQSMILLMKIKPFCVLGVGGYVSGPTGLAAWLLRIPLVIHEQNAVAGTANRWLAKFASCILESFPNTFKQTKKGRISCSGNPVRKDLVTKLSNIDGGELKERLHLLVIGGSSGAMIFNQVVPSTINTLSAQVRPEVAHQTGQGAANSIKNAYASDVNCNVAEFFTDMPERYAWADLVLCRAGSSTLFELALTATPAILVPLPHAIDDHQSKNADWLTQGGAAVVLPQAHLSSDSLAKTILQFIAQPGRLSVMSRCAAKLARPDAATQVADTCMEFLRN